MQQRQTKGLLLVLGAAILVLLGFFLLLGIFYQFTTDNTQNYFVQIDNTQVSEITPHGGMNYRYTLRAFDVAGAEKEIDFDTSRILKEGAFVCLEVAPVRGIISWSEVDYSELPDIVQKEYKK